MAIAESLRQRLRHFRLRLDNFCLHLLRIRTHFLFLGNCHGASFFRLSLCDAFFCFRLIGQQFCADITPHIHVGDINGKNFKCSTGVQSFGQHSPRNMIRIFQYGAMVIRRTNCCNNTFTNTGDDGRLAGAADQSVDIGPHCHARFYLQFNAVFRHSGNDWCFNNAGVDTHLHCFQYVTAGQVNGAGPFKSKVNFRSMRRNQRINNAVHVAAC